jgi:hypothetical protein
LTGKAAGANPFLPDNHPLKRTKILSCCVFSALKKQENTSERDFFWKIYSAEKKHGNNEAKAFIRNYYAQ